jgi:hypothetical protein
VVYPVRHIFIVRKAEMEKSPLPVANIDKAITELMRKTDHKIVATWAADCAERVLPYFQRTFSNDNRPRKAIQTGRAWVRGEGGVIEARIAAFAAYDAARDAHPFAVARFAARAAGHAAATAHAPSHALHAAAYAATAVRDAASRADAESAIAAEREWQYQHLLTLSEHA